MSNLTPEEKDRLFKILDHHTEQNDRIERALYGDEKNRVKGALERIEHIEGWITKSKMKIAYISGGVAVVVFLCKAAWAWILENWRK